MREWHDVILQALPSGLSSVTVVYDPDSLLREQDILDAVRERGFCIIDIDDPIQFRFAWESQFRVGWDNGEASQLLILIPYAQHSVPSLPFDVLTDSRVVHYSLAQLFPQLEYSVLKSLDPGHYELLFNAVQVADIGVLGTNATSDFILRHVFEVAPELVKTPVDCLRMLLRRHYVRLNVPQMLDDRMDTLLRERSQLVDWLIAPLLRDRTVFLRFLQERWNAYVVAADKAGSQRVVFVVAGPRSLPFAHDDIRVYIDNYFTDGLLQPLPVSTDHLFLSSWESVGVSVDRRVVAEQRAMRLSLRLMEQIPSTEARTDEWCRFAYRWGELSVLSLSEADVRSGVQWEAVRQEVDRVFAEWLANHYAGLATLPPTPPAMVHHVPKYAARELQDNNGKVAIVVIDGLAMYQWIVIRDVIREQNQTIEFEEQAAFAWLPTLTSVSRQAIFAGVPPLYFPDSLDSTDREAKLWTRFWSQQGVQDREVAYIKGLGRDGFEGVEEILTSQQIRAVGLVVDTVDRIMHGMQLGSAGMISQVTQWCREGYLTRLLRCLLDNAFLPIIVSDHGNTDARGCGRISEGAVSEVRGQRVRVCRELALRDRVVAERPGSRAGLHDGLPNDYWPVYPPIGAAFVTDGVSVVAHGGDSLDEVIVPVVTVRSTGMTK